MTAPVRLRLSRAPGARLQQLSAATNGLPAINVARPSRWGNPFKPAPAYRDAFCNLPEITPARAVSLYRERWTGMLATWPSARADLSVLRGRNLACWCALDAPCHADVLLELANAELGSDLPNPSIPPEVFMTTDNRSSREQSSAVLGGGDRA